MDPEDLEEENRLLVYACGSLIARYYMDVHGRMPTREESRQIMREALEGQETKS